jgi:molecular chaperone Hsp33
MHVKVASLSDTITPFLVDRASVRGRVAKLVNVAQLILSRYDYPEPVAKLLGELLLVASMLSSNLKQDGIFTIQIKGNGLVKLVVVDAVHGGALRGFAEVSDTAKKEINNLGSSLPLGLNESIERLGSALPLDLKKLLGDEAYVAITLDPGEGMHRYQGVVALEGESITEALAHYFTQSQQLDVMFRFAVEKKILPGTGAPIWMAGGMMIERLPEAGNHIERLGSSLPLDSNTSEGWRYANAIARTVKDEELLDPLLDAQTLLYRLFHEEGVWVYGAQNLSVGCRCSRERILALLKSMPLEERADMLKSGAASVHCQFCNTAEKFSREELGITTA